MALGLSPEQAQAEITAIDGFFDALPETEQVYRAWKHIVSLHKGEAKRVNL
jgi:hypothetical protein